MRAVCCAQHPDVPGVGAWVRRLVQTNVLPPCNALFAKLFPHAHDEPPSAVALPTAAKAALSSMAKVHGRTRTQLHARLNATEI